MKVLFSASVFRHLTAFHLPYMKYLQSRGIEVYAAANQEDIEKMDILEREGIKCEIISFKRNPFHFKNIVAYLELKKLQNKKQFDLIHTHTPMASFLIRYVYRKNSFTKVIYTAHGFHFYKGSSKLSWYLYYNMEKLARRWTDYIITINSEDYRNAILLGFKQNQISHTYGVGFEHKYEEILGSTADKLKKEFHIKENDIVITGVAELNKNKNQIFLLRNWKNLKAENPNIKLVLVGTGDYENTLKKFVKVNNLQDVYFAGYRNDVMDIYQISHIAFLLSKREGFGRCLLEAMICNLPCIATNTRGPRDLIIDGETGLLIDLENDKALVDTFNKLIKDKELRKEIGERSKLLAEKFFLKNVLEVYKEIYAKFL